MKKNVLIIVTGLVFAIAIYWVRMGQKQDVMAIGKSDQGYVLSESVFKKRVVEPNAELLNKSLLSLIVFCDLRQDCPGYIFEAEQWAKPIGVYDRSIYNLLVFIPAETEEKMVRSFLEGYALEESNIVLYEPANDLDVYQTGRVLKLAYSLLDGLKWYEFGNALEGEQEAFYFRLTEEIEAHL